MPNAGDGACATPAESSGKGVWPIAKFFGDPPDFGRSCRADAGIFSTATGTQGGGNRALRNACGFCNVDQLNVVIQLA